MKDKRPVRKIARLFYWLKTLPHQVLTLVSSRARAGRTRSGRDVLSGAFYLKGVHNEAK